MLDLDVESPLSLTEAAKSLPGRPHVCTLHRWRLRGIRGVQLETILIGGRRYTTREALHRFFVATTAASGDAIQPAAQTCQLRERAIEEAERELAAVGI